MKQEKDAPKRKFRHGSINEIPAFNLVHEIFKAVDYAKTGWPTVTRETGSYDNIRVAQARAKTDSLIPIIKKLGKITAEGLANYLGDSENTTHKRMRQLFTEGILDRDDLRPHRYWVKEK